MEELTGNNILTALAVILAVAASVVTLEKGIEACKKLFGHGASEARMKNLEHVQQCENTKLHELDVRMSNTESGQQQIMSAIKALLHHEITGNSVDKLRAAEENLDKFLITNFGGDRT